MKLIQNGSSKIEVTRYLIVSYSVIIGELQRLQITDISSFSPGGGRPKKYNPCVRPLCAPSIKAQSYNKFENFK